MASASLGSASTSTASSNVLTGALSWNGQETSTAPNPSSAISWTFSTVATVVFSWTGPVGGAGVSQAFLVILFLGFPVYTKQQVESSPLPATGGSISMTYDLTQFKWYLQGLYQVHGYLEDPSGNVLWSENFYVRVAQPYDIVVSTVGLLLLVIAELYMIATVGPRAADKMRAATGKPSTAPPSTEPTEAPASGGTTPPPQGGSNGSG